MVSDVTHEQMEGQQAESLPNGYRWVFPEGHTDLLIDPAHIEENEWGLGEVVMVETLVEISSSVADA